MRSCAIFRGWPKPPSTVSRRFVETQDTLPRTVLPIRRAVLRASVRKYFSWAAPPTTAFTRSAFHRSLTKIVLSFVRIECVKNFKLLSLNIVLTLGFVTFEEVHAFGSPPPGEPGLPRPAPTPNPTPELPKPELPSPEPKPPVQPAPPPPEQPAPKPEPAPKPPGPPTTPPSAPPQLDVPSMKDLYDLSKFNGTKNVGSTIVINKPGVYDFKNVLHIWKGRNWDCNAERENGPQILRVEASNVTVKNFAYVGDGKTHGSNGLGDPIHIATCGSGQGNLCPQPGPSKVVLDGIYGHACEDLLTIGTPGTRDITVQNSTFIPTPSKKNWDKIVQINFGEDLKFYNNLFWGSERCIRFKPNTHGIVEGNEFRNCKDSVLLSSRDKDIRPMTNGPSSVLLRNNNYNGSRVRCKNNKGSNTVGSSGMQVCD
jgi:hypothetical protein